MIINLSTRRIQVISQQRTYTVYKSFIHKMVAKKAGMDRERNYVTVALFMSALAPSGGAYSVHRPPISALLPQFCGTSDFRR